MKSRVRLKYLVCLVFQITGFVLFHMEFVDDGISLRTIGWIVATLGTLSIFFLKCEQCKKTMWSELKVFSTEGATFNPFVGFRRSMEKFEADWARGVWSFPFRKRCPFCDLERH